MDQKLEKTIIQTYKKRFDEMEIDYQLHFASRLAAWNQDKWAQQKLKILKPKFVADSAEQRVAQLSTIVRSLNQKDMLRDVNNYEQRSPYFRKYNNLLALHSLLFRIRHWYAIYGIDDRESLFRIIPEIEVESLMQKLIEDRQAIKILSTYVVNVFYLYSLLYDRDYKPLNLINSVETDYDLEDRIDIQMYIYLLTHCIIGETLFYYRPINQKQELYNRMIHRLDSLINTQFEQINLDSKCEVMVCAQLCEYDLETRVRIDKEAALSLNNEGFIVDTLNKNGNPNKQTFLMSEHRNVLYVLSRNRPHLTGEIKPFNQPI